MRVPTPEPRTFAARRVRWLTLVTAALLASSLNTPATAAPAPSSPGPDFEMPFPCADTWNGKTFHGHSPSVLAIDWNKENDLGAQTVSSAPGVITTVGNLGNRSYGRYVIVDHGSGWTTLYAHLSATWVVTGQSIDQGTVLGLVGSSGGSTGPHLHFEERFLRKDQQTYFNRTQFVMGTTKASLNCGDVPLVADSDGNGTDNVGVFRRTAASQFIIKRPKRRALNYVFGLPTDQPISGDWNGDGITDVGVRRPSSKAFLLRLPNGTTQEIPLGSVSDFAVTGDWNGDGKTDLGTWHPDTRTFTLRTTNGKESRVVLGATGDRPIAGDWNGDGLTDVGTYNPSSATFNLRTATKAGAVTTTSTVWGNPNVLPVAGDWNGDDIGDIGVWDPTTATYSLRVTPSASRTPRPRTPKWGVPRF